MYEAVVWNEVLGNATATLISGRPDCFDTIKAHLSYYDAVRVAKNHNGNCAVRQMGERSYLLRGPGDLSFAWDVIKNHANENDEQLIKRVRDATVKFYEELDR